MRGARTRTQRPTLSSRTGGRRWHRCASGDTPPPLSSHHRCWERTCRTSSSRQVRWPLHVGDAESIDSRTELLHPHSRKTQSLLIGVKL
eukprot:5267193-Pleurochrysis_carterae.AAC.1